MRIAIGSNKQKTCDMAFERVVSDVSMHAGCEVFLVVEDFDDGWKCLSRLERMGVVTDMLSNYNEIAVEFENKSVLRVIAATYFLETNSHLTVRKPRYLHLLCDFFNRLNYWEFPPIHLLAFSDMNVYHYCSVTTPDNLPDDIIEIDCDYECVLWKRHIVDMQVILDMIDALYEVCRKDRFHKGDYVVVDFKDIRQYCDYCCNCVCDEKVVHDCVKIGDKVVACRRCRYYLELMMSCLNGEDKIVAVK